MPFRKVNNVTGWIVGGIACIVYLLTREASGSFWDCGEFIAAANKVQIPHPPGAPLFVLLGRIFILFSPSNPAMGVNTLSALGSGLSILFLFWTITHFARKMYPSDVYTVMTAGVVGALAYTFTDSFWFSAVEGEVYGMSGFFTALVYWTALKWENRADQPGSDKWIVLLFFFIGLSVGVHLLSLLTIPAVVMIYYFRRYAYSTKGLVIALVIGCVLTGFVQTAVIQKTANWASYLDIFFVNHIGLPYFSGFATFYLLLAALIFIGIRLSKRLDFLRLGLWCLTFLLIGYSPYITTMERSNADPAIDMYNVDNPISLAGYLGRDQYGDFPLLWGQNFTAEPKYIPDGPLYARDSGRYVVVGQKEREEFDQQDKMWFPRVWDISNDQGHRDFYAEWLRIPQTANGGYAHAPTQADNVTWFLTYQLAWMYGRYFAWNFVGRQNDLEGFGNPRDGNWITGINFLDKLWLGDQHRLPDAAHTQNKANNPLYGLPFLLGVLGFVAQYRRGRKDWIVNIVLFFFTGLAIILYLNQPGNQPRERDYAYTGSFYAFAVWIGLGVCLVRQWMSRLPAYVPAGLCLLAVPLLMAIREWDDHDRSHKTLALSMATDYLQSCAPDAILFTFGDNDTYPLWFAQEAMGVRPDVRVVNTSILSMDWYINQLRYKINQSDPIDPFWTPAQIAGNKRDVMFSWSFVSRDAPPETTPVDLETMLKEAGSDDPAFTAETRDGTRFSTFPSHFVSVPVDTALVRRNGTADPGDTVASQLQFRIPMNALQKGDAAVLGIIAANHWRRPIYFTISYDALGIGDYLRQDGLAYRLVPVARQPVHQDYMKEKLLNVFTFGGAGRPGVYFDEENRTHLLTLREAYITLANSLTHAGRAAEARAVLEKCDQGIDPGNMPYGMCSRYGNYHDKTSENFAEAAYQAGDLPLARKVDASLRKDCAQQVGYLHALRGEGIPSGGFLEEEAKTAGDILKDLDAWKAQYDHPPVQP